ncbi:MAG: hypothetical protein V1916_02615, partial [Patescibacteria group bacterium]
MPRGENIPHGDLDGTQNTCAVCGLSLDSGDHSACQQEKAEPAIESESEKVVDSEGVERTIHTFVSKTGHEVKALFYSPDELPYSSEMVNGRQGFIIGNEPKIRSRGEWQEFKDKVRAGSSKDISPTTQMAQDISEAKLGGTASFFVESSPVALLDLAFYLGAEDSKFREMRQKLGHGEMSPEIVDMMDKIIAGKIIDEHGDLRFERNENGEALVLRSLLGDGAAEKILQDRLVALRARDQVLREEEMSEMEE